MQFYRYAIGNEESIWLCDECDIEEGWEWLESDNDSYGDMVCDACGCEG